MAKSRIIGGNKKGYNASTSPLDNTTNKGLYEKKVDTIQKGKPGESVRLIDGKGNVIQQERTRTKAASDLVNKFNKLKSDTNERRKRNSEFLDSRSKSGAVANKTIKKK